MMACLCHSGGVGVLCACVCMNEAPTCFSAALFANRGVIILQQASLMLLLGVADARKWSVCTHSMDWRCRARVTPARSPWRAHVACAPRLRQRQSFSRMLLSQYT